MTKFYLVRHGATKMNKTDATSVDKERGWSDVPLTAEGRAEAQKAGLKLRGRGIEHMESSDLNRARETARTIGSHIGVKPKFTRDLRPWNLGDFTDKDLKQVQPKMEDYARNKPDQPVPGGESFNRFVGRVLPAVAKHIDTAKGRRSLLVSHHRVERLLSSLRPDGSIDHNEFFKDGDPPGGVMTFDMDPKHLRDAASNYGRTTSPPSRGSRRRGPGASAPRTQTPENDVRQRGIPRGTPPSPATPPGPAERPLSPGMASRGNLQAATNSSASQLTPKNAAKPLPGVADKRHHSLSMGGLHHLLKAGHITPEEHGRLSKKVRAAMVMRAALRPT